MKRPVIHNTTISLRISTKLHKDLKKITKGKTSVSDYIRKVIVSKVERIKCLKK